jgi:hypothetical protein
MRSRRQSGSCASFTASCAESPTPCSGRHLRGQAIEVTVRFEQVQKRTRSDRAPHAGELRIGASGQPLPAAAADLTRARGWDAKKCTQGWSGRQDLNLRPLRPERNALAKLSYAPMSQSVRRQRAREATPTDQCCSERSSLGIVALRAVN